VIFNWASAVSVFARTLHKRLFMLYIVHHKRYIFSLRYNTLFLSNTVETLSQGENTQILINFKICFRILKNYKWSGASFIKTGLVLGWDLKRRNYCLEKKDLWDIKTAPSLLSFSPNKMLHVLILEKWKTSLDKNSFKDSGSWFERDREKNIFVILLSHFSLYWMRVNNVTNKSKSNSYQCFTEPPPISLN
jgi:hypothetical protein